jgi:hypothetical protein
MKKNFINYLVNKNSDMIIEKSLKNCHIKGLNSIMLSDVPENRIRLFYVVKGHELSNEFHESYLALHPHHCDITISVVKGHLTNYNCEILNENYGSGMLYSKYEYKSKINDDDIGFVYKGDEFIRFSERTELHKKDLLYLPAKTLHTVKANDDNTAWLIFEGKEDNTYENVCYSPKFGKQPNDFDYSEYYQKYDSINEIIQILLKYKLL